MGPNPSLSLLVLQGAMQRLTVLARNWILVQTQVLCLNPNMHCCVGRRFSTNASAEDTDVQFRVWAIKSAVKRVPLYVQVGTDDSKPPLLAPASLFLHVQLTNG